MKLRKRFGVVLVLAMLVSVLAMTMTASAAKKTKISQKSATIAAGKSVKLSVKNAKGKKVKWSSEDEDIAKVGSNGKVTGLAGGEATIVAKVGGKSYKCTVTVEAVQFKDLKTENHKTVYVSSNTLDPTGAEAKIEGRNTKDLKPYVVSYPTGLALKWSSSNPKVATVENGVVKAVANGDCVVTVEAADGSGAADTVVVVVRDMGDDTTNPVVITMANKDRLFDKYIGKVKVSTFFVDKDGNILPNGYKYAKVDTDNKNAESWKDPVTGLDYEAFYMDTYFYYVKDAKVNAVTSSGSLTVKYNINWLKANFDGKKLGIDKNTKIKVNPEADKDYVEFGQVAFPKDADEIIVYKDAKGKAYNGFKKTVYSVSGVAGKTLLAGMYYVDAVDGTKYPWKFSSVSDEVVTNCNIVLYN
jgi:uncharacterized protein YjdB